jgi:hypothetical protein
MTAPAHRGKVRQRSVAARAVERSAVGAVETNNQETCGHPIGEEDVCVEKVRQFSAEDKIRIVPKGLRGDHRTANHFPHVLAAVLCNLINDEIKFTPQAGR